MPLAGKAPSQITENDLIALILNKEAERKVVEYKRDLVGPRDDHRKEFLYDVSSFANTQGGYLISGIEEAGGLPINLVGFSDLDSDQEILRLEQIVRSGIRPQISGIETDLVSLSGGRIAIVMRIPRSWNPPTKLRFNMPFAFTGAAATENIKWMKMSCGSNMESRLTLPIKYRTFVWRVLIRYSVEALPSCFSMVAILYFMLFHSVPSMLALASRSERWRVIRTGFQP